ncbi:MAG: hypothetical protein GXO26_09670, partial [Crenarchaeota archaeon]|nr:hypothetical protein [Thermoproteota archaeon]
MYRRSSIGFLLRGVSIALIFIVIPLLLLRVLENIALMVHNFKFSKIIGKLYVPVLIICSLASLSVILERLSIFYIASNRENRGIIFGILTNISTSAVIAILISLILYNLVPLSYIIVLCLGIVSSSVIPVIFFRLRRRIQILISLTVIYVSLIPILQLITSKVGGVSSLIYVPPILLIISILADIRENIKKILAKITFIILVVVLLSTYVVSARSIIFSLVFSRDPALSYVMDSLIISL